MYGTLIVLNPLIAGAGNLKVMAHNYLHFGIFIALNSINRIFPGLLFIRNATSLSYMPAWVCRCECYLHRQYSAKDTIKSLVQMEPGDRFMQRRFG